ncbi:MAG: hypothetical protein AABX47_06725 [Nanoarchaeota archaeon]
MASSAVKCKRCGTAVKSFSPMRKWCFDCRKRVTVEQAKDRKGRLKMSR